jgi:hydroxyethylthiazole kinase-like uncharacterized protein yjeF
MKIIRPAQIKQCDAYSINYLQISSIDLIQNAAAACANFILNKIVKPDKVIIVCGKGNNGAIGLALASMLKTHKYLTEVYIIQHSKNATPDFEEYKKRYQGDITVINQLYDLCFYSTKKTLIIDAIIGNGLNKSIEGVIKHVVEQLNASEGFKLAIDISTGLFANKKNEKQELTFKAQQTITFQLPKLSFMMKENYQSVGNFEIVDIGWPLETTKKIETDYYYTTISDCVALFKKRERFVSKHNFGHALIIAGEYGKTGAALLATKACLRSGAGLTTTYSASCAFNVIQSMAPEAIFMADPNEKYITDLPDLKKFNAIAIGSGIGLNEQTIHMVEALLLSCEKRIVLDADALNIIALNKRLLDLIKPETIITPHEKEFERLTKKCDTDFDRIKIAIGFAKKYKLILVLKGVYTAIINSDGKVYFNSTGNSSLAKGGTGDTLTGIIVSQLAQGYSPLHAAILSVFIHGAAADLCIQSKGNESVIASDIIENISVVFKDFFR